MIIRLFLYFMIESSSICFQPWSWGDFLCKLINRLEQGTDGMLAGAPGSRPHGMLFHWPVYTIIDRPYRLQSSDNTERFYWMKINCSVKTTVRPQRMLLLPQIKSGQTGFKTCSLLLKPYRCRQFSKIAI